MHRTEIHVRWGDLDPYNHVNHAVYSSYLEHARVDLLDAVGADLDALANDTIQVVVVRSDVRFLSPATAGETLTVTTRIAEIKGASVVWEQSIDRNDDAIVNARITTAVLGDRGRPIRIPEPLRSALGALN